MRFDAFVGPSYRSQSPIADGERCVNWYPERIESGQGKNAFALYPTPGVVARWNLPLSPIRALFAQNDRAFAVAGSTLYELHDDYTFTSRGAMATDQYPATICSNGIPGDQMFVTSGTLGYIFDLTSNTLTAVTTAVRMGAFLNGYFLGLDPTTTTLKLSDLEDGTTWSATQIIQRNIGGDKWQAMTVSNGLIYLWGSQTTDVYYDAGTSPIPFEAIAQAAIPHGIIAPFAFAESDVGPMWVSQSSHGRGMVYLASGYEAKRISDHGVEYAIQRYSTVTDAIGYSYQDQGHQFGLFTFPSEHGTWVYDGATQVWHERLFWNQPKVSYQAHRPLYHCYAFGRHIVGDRLGSTVYEQNVTHYRDVESQDIRRMRHAPHLSLENKFLSIREFTLDLETGVGAATGAGSDPQVMLRWATDGGKTWSNEHWVTAGKLGAYSARAVWHRLGRARDRVIEVVVADPVAWRIVNAYLEVA